MTLVFPKLPSVLEQLVVASKSSSKRRTPSTRLAPMTATLSHEDSTKRVLFQETDDEETPAGPARDENDESASADFTLQSTKQGVSLDSLSENKYSLSDCRLPPLSELEPVEIFVMNAVKSKLEESPDPAHVQGYKAIIDSLRRPTDPNMIRNVLISLRTAGNGTILTMIATNPTIHAQLIHVIFRFFPGGPPKPLKSDEAEMERFEQNSKIYNQMNVMDAHLHFMLALVSAKSSHLIPAMTAVWRMLAMHSTLKEPMYQRLHGMLYTMFQLFPKARADFFTLVASKFPHIKCDRAQLTHYCLQSFKVLKYLPTMRKQLLEIVIDKCLEIDVNIKINANGEVSIEQAENQDDAGKALNDNLKTIKGGAMDESKKQSNTKDDVVDGFSDKLDSLLKLLLDEIRIASKDGVVAREIYYELLPVFESTILTTHKAKYVQFCMFYCCALESGATAEESSGDPRYVEHAILHRDFAAKLLETIMDAYRATLTRQSGACYLASFISRASFVGPDTICESVSALLRWAEAYIESVGRYGVHAADSREQSEYHSLFYTVCQAAFYIMCFRGTEAIDYYRKTVASYSSMELTEGYMDNNYLPDPAHVDLGAERWTMICSHELQPLRYCLESVRSEFLHIAHAFNLIDSCKLDKLVEDAKRLSTGRVNKRAASKISTAATLSVQRRKGGVGGLGRGSNPLRSFFPFDPLLLRRSHKSIEPFYRHWQGPVEEEDALSIDDGSQASENDEGIFDMDDSSGDENVNDRPPAGICDQYTGRHIKVKGDDDEDDFDAYGMQTPDAHEKKELQRKAWTETTKRPRSQSMENGSW